MKQHFGAVFRCWKTFAANKPSWLRSSVWVSIKFFWVLWRVCLNKVNHQKSSCNSFWYHHAALRIQQKKCIAGPEPKSLQKTFNSEGLMVCVFLDVLGECSTHGFISCTWLAVSFLKRKPQHHAPTGSLPKNVNPDQADTQPPNTLPSPPSTPAFEPTSDLETAKERERFQKVIPLNKKTEPATKPPQSEPAQPAAKSAAKAQQWVARATTHPN